MCHVNLRSPGGARVPRWPRAAARRRARPFLDRACKQIVAWL